MQRSFAQGTACACKMLLLLLIVQVTVIQKGRSQDMNKTKIVLELRDETLKTALARISRLSGIPFSYSPESVAKFNHIQLDKQSRTVAEMLTIVLQGTSLQFIQKGNHIVILPATPARQQEKSAADRLLSGKVTGEKGEPLAGVSVKLKGAQGAAVTNAEGSYAVFVPVREATLVFSYIGYISREIHAGDSVSLNIVLKQMAATLDDVVVIGYGSVKKEDVTGSVGQVNVNDLVKAPVASFDQALAGRIAGVQVSSAEDGQPGSGMNIVIRGANSLTQTNAPLYVIDGFPIEDPQSAGINPDDIESISILKDASATAIYGARGANGVIVIETKKGKTGKSVFSFNSSVGVEKVPKTMALLSPYEFVKYEQERYENTSEPTGYLDNGKTLESYRQVAGTHWQDLLFRTGTTQIHNIALRGGNAQTKYALSASMYDSKAIIVNSGYKRYQARFSLDHTVNNRVKVGVNANYSNQLTFGQVVGRTSATSSTTISGYLLYSVWGYRPVTNTTIDNGNDNLEDQLLDDGIDPAVDFRINPIKSAENTLRNRRVNNITANAYASYDFSNNLTLRISAGMNGLLTRNDAFYNSQTVKGTPLRANNIQGVNGSVFYGERMDWLNENTLTWKKKINRDHQVEVMGGFTMQGLRGSSYGYSSILVPNEELGINGLSQGTPLETTSETGQSRLLSFVSRANYSYQSKYLFTATMRADGSSKFAPGRRWGYFPSGAFAWRMNKESFMKGLSAVSDAKLRVSYGITGNNRVGNYSYLPSIELPDLGSYSFNNERFYGLNMGNLGNQELRWESTSQVDIGYDLGLLKNRINLIVDVYSKTTYNLLLNADLPYTTGYSNSFKNVGKVRNQGLEITLNTVNLRMRSFSWESNFNISFNNNKILALAENQTNLLSRISSFVSRMAEEPLYIAETGKPAAMFYGLIWDGVYQYSDFNETAPGKYALKLTVPTNGDVRESIQPGDIKYKDINRDGTIDAYDKTVIGRALPIHTGGFANNFTYKGFGLNTLFQWSYGNKLMNANRLIFEGNATGSPHMNQFASWANRWTPENQTNALFREGGEGPQVMSSRTLEDGSYIRLKTVSLFYNLPVSFVRKIGMSSFSANISAQNLYTWTKYSGMDPEVSVQNSVLTPGFDFSAYPHARTIVFGIKATF